MDLVLRWEMPFENFRLCFILFFISMKKTITFLMLAEVHGGGF
jgi:hypothetical protein